MKRPGRKRKPKRRRIARPKAARRRPRHPAVRPKAKSGKAVRRPRPTATPPIATPAAPDLEATSRELNKVLRVIASEIPDFVFLLRAAIDPFAAVPQPEAPVVAPDNLAPAGEDPFGTAEPFATKAASVTKPSPLPPAAQPLAAPLPLLHFELEEDPAREDPARMDADAVLVNTSHAAWRRAAADGHLPYHLAFCLGWVVAGLVEPDRSGRRFLSRFLALWGADSA